MKIGFGAPVSGAWATPDNLASFAASAESAGYESLWTFQRLIVPEGSAMDPVYHSVLDPMVALGFAAASTRRIRLCVAVLNMPYVAPAVVAKQAATVDVLSRGRHELGLGIGWMPEEFTLTGPTMARRGARTAEFIEVLRRFWAEGVTEFNGEFYTVPPSRMAPKPVQRPGPPILLGGLARPALERAGRLGDGWVTSSRTDLSRIAEGVAVVREAAEKAGRDPGSVRIICRGVVHAGAPLTIPEGGGRVLLSGSFDEIRSDAEWLAERGVTELFYDLNWDPLVGAPDVDPVGATARAEEILEALAPAR
ncbi:MAG TPA: TIGR03619 family F420-dependent LLM class oxidoreductase [Streptosporangiaceae bacterium]|jgi:probable F420-dependent oxidoreductase|nr:TIGR03619 family F420-dependent LLM class oxidoreductase [Streptosporangiaceae bacterium]